MINRDTVDKMDAFIKGDKPMSIDWHKVLKSATEFPDLKLLSYKESKLKYADTTREWFIGFRSLTRAPLKVIELSDDLVWAITKLSLEVPPSILMEYALQTRMPFDTVLFTWNGEARNRSYVDNNAEVFDSSPVTEVPAMIVSSTIAGKMVTDLAYDKGKLAVFPVVYWIWNDARKADERDVTIGVNVQPRNMEHMNGRLPDGHSAHVHFWLTTPIVERYPEFADQMETDKHFTTSIIPPTGLVMLAKEPELDKQFENAYSNIVRRITAGTAGNPRWFAALCTLMSYQSKPRIAQADEPVTQSDKRVRQSRAHTTWTLFLPREKVVKSAVRHLLVHRKPVGKHEVGGFWSMRHSNSHCHHAWPAEPTRRQRCEHCGTLRWWTASHQRGTGPLQTVKRKLDYSGALSKVINDIKSESE